VTARYSILVLERFGDREVKLCDCESNPEAIVQALKTRTIRVGRSRRYRFTSIRIVENFAQDAAGPPAGEALRRASTQTATEPEKDQVNEIE
jgi:hypothetical protein